MRYLSLALFAEGPSDLGFLQRIIYRAVHEAAFDLSNEAFEVQEAFIRSEPVRHGLGRAQRIHDGYKRLLASGAVTLLFIHSDAGGDGQAARCERIDPACALLAESIAGEVLYGTIAVVPVRETEAWALSDRAALAAELDAGSAVDELFGRRGPAAVETIPDPKQVLSEFLQARRPRKRRLSASEVIPPSLGDRISLSVLREVPAFQVFDAELRSTLQHLWRVR